MRRDEGSLECEMTRQIAWDEVRNISTASGCSLKLRDSTRYRAAKIMFSPQIAEAIIPGAALAICNVPDPGMRSRLPRAIAKEPSTGPSATPRLVVAESHPSARARSLGSVESAT